MIGYVWSDHRLGYEGERKGENGREWERMGENGREL